jgi:integrase
MARVFIREKLLANGTASLILDYTEHGQRRKQTLKIYVNPKDAKSRNFIQRNAYDESYKQANMLKLALELRLTVNEHDLPITYDKTLSFIEYFSRLAATRSRNWHSVGYHLNAFTKGKLTFGQVTEEWVSRFQDYLGTRVQPSTTCMYMCVFTTSLNLAVREKLLESNPSKYVRKVRAPEKDPKFLTKEQLDVLAANRTGVPDWLVDTFMFSCYTGLRISDVEGLNWGHLKRTGKTKEGLERLTIVKQQVKTQGTIRVPICAQAATILQRYHVDGNTNQDSLVFALKSRSQIKRYVERWREQTGIFFTFHSSRHSFGTALQTAEVDLHTTSKLLGHKSLSMTMRYARVTDGSRDAAIDKLANHWG